MTLIEFFEAIAKLSGVLFVVASMLAMGLSLTMAQILQPLKNIRLVVLDTIEPAAGAFHLAILHPPRDELGSPMCSQVSASEGMGFGGMDIGPATASYDPARGLTVSLPVSVYDPDAAEFYSVKWLSVTINSTPCSPTSPSAGVPCRRAVPAPLKLTSDNSSHAGRETKLTSKDSELFSSVVATW